MGVARKDIPKTKWSQGRTDRAEVLLHPTDPLGTGSLGTARPRWRERATGEKPWHNTAETGGGWWELRRTVLYAINFSNVQPAWTGGSYTPSSNGRFEMPQKFEIPATEPGEGP